MKTDIEPWKINLEPQKTMKTYLEPWKTNLELWKTMKNQPGNMKNQPGTNKNHENRRGTMNYQPGTMDTHENRPGTINKQKRYKQNLPIIYRSSPSSSWPGPHALPQWRETRQRRAVCGNPLLRLLHHAQEGRLRQGQGFCRTSGASFQITYKTQDL